MNDYDKYGDSMPINIKRTYIKITPNTKRVLLRPFHQMELERSKRIITALTKLTESDVEKQIADIRRDFSRRHHQIEQFWLEQFNSVSARLSLTQKISYKRKLLIGAYFTQEYAIEAAALFNPSIVWHPDQSGLPADARRFILSMRATGEGHISSLVFRTGIVYADGQIELDSQSSLAVEPGSRIDIPVDKDVLLDRLQRKHVHQDLIRAIREQPDSIMSRQSVDKMVLEVQHDGTVSKSDIEMVYMHAFTNYNVSFDSDLPLSECVIFPSTLAEQNGIEDVRLVEFQKPNDERCYYGTYTAYDGTTIQPYLLETDDFRQFRVRVLVGAEAMNKGFALFPEKINGRFAMLSRQDGEKIFIMYSDTLYTWDEKQLLISPYFSWELVQLGNCGSPLKTDAGWLVLTHGVGPMRTYSIGALLLDLNDPSRMIGRSTEPILTATVDERNGYVPNVVYSCGGVLFNKQLILPYAMSDSASSFAIVDLNELLDSMIPLH